MRKLIVVVTTLAAILVSAAPVHAVSFNFSFSNQFPLGDVPGAVAGRIGLNNQSSATRAAFITSSPAALGYPLTALDNNLSQPSINDVVSNSFTVTGGVLTSIDFRALFPIANSQPQEFFLLTLILGSEFIANRFGQTTDHKVVSNSATFVPVSQVPLPTALPFFTTGIGALGLLG